MQRMLYMQITIAINNQFNLTHFIESSSEGYKFYVAAEHMARNVPNAFLIFFVASITVSLLIPVIVVIYYYLDGSYSADKWKLPTCMEYDILAFFYPI